MPYARIARRSLLAAAILFGTASGNSVAAETLRVGKSTLTSFSYTLLEVGMHSGIFRKHGLEIESSAFGGGPRLIQAMTAGAIDIGLDGGTDMAMIVKGAPMKAIAPLSGAPLEMVWTDAQSYPGLWFAARGTPRAKLATEMTHAEWQAARRDLMRRRCRQTRAPGPGAGFSSTRRRRHASG